MNKNVLWTKVSAVLVMGALTVTAGCGAQQAPAPAAPAEETASEKKEEPAEAPAEEAAQVEEEPVTEEASGSEEEKAVFEELSHWAFDFSSGAGGWGTSFTVEPDGSFSGEYHDSEMGDTGDGYENGSVYLASFSGQFEGCREMADGSYEIGIKELNYENTPGTEEIEDNIRYEYAEAYGFSGTDSLIVYLPGTPTDELPEEYMSWITPLYFGAYIGDEYYQDIPPELPFCGLYNEPEELGMFSSSRTAENREFLVNRGHFPGLVSEMQELNEDGTYHYEDAEQSGMYRVVNLCFPMADDLSLFSDGDKFAKACIKELTGEEDPQDYYAIGVNDEYSQEKTYISGDRCMEISWTTGSNEDTMYWVARAMKRDGYEPGQGYAFVYAISYDPDGDLMTGEAANFLLTSLCLAGTPEHLSSASDFTAEKKIFVEAKAGSAEDTVDADEVVWISGGDEDLMKEYGISPDDITNDYAIGGYDEEFTAYPVAEGSDSYAQYPENPFHKLMNRTEFHDYLVKGEVSRLMEFYLDENGQVVFAYEPYTP